MGVTDIITIISKNLQLLSQLEILIISSVMHIISFPIKIKNISEKSRI